MTEHDSTPTIRIFQMDDIEWWAGESLSACVEAGRAMCGAECYPDVGEQGELSDDQMQRFKFVDEDGGERTFAEELQRRIAAGESFPQPFAATDY